jgi:hypothetical protein
MTSALIRKHRLESLGYTLETVIKYRESVPRNQIGSVDNSYLASTHTSDAGNISTLC